MRLHVIRDLHLEFGDQQPPPVDAEMVLAAGDIRPGKGVVRWLATAYPHLPVLFVRATPSTTATPVEPGSGSMAIPTSRPTIPLAPPESLQIPADMWERWSPDSIRAW